MFETGMSALVLKICSEYAKALGLNFPPCVQQEINAICEWVDKHTIKDMSISQDEYNVTFTFKTENDTTKQFTFTIPKTIDIDELEKVLIGSDSVVVERLEDNSGLRLRLDQSVINDINSKLAKPAKPTAESAVTMKADGTVGTKLLSEIGGGKLYLHNITCSGPSGTTIYDVQIKAITYSATPYTYDTYNSLSIYKKAICVQFGFTDSSSNYHYYPTGSLKSAGGITYYENTTLKNFSMYSISYRFADTVTEL